MMVLKNELGKAIGNVLYISLHCAVDCDLKNAPSLVSMKGLKGNCHIQNVIQKS